MPKLPRWFWTASFLVCWPTLLLAADPTFSVTGPEGRLTLTSEPCKAHEWLKKWQLARWLWKGEPYEACWRMQSDGSGQRFVVVVDSAGDVATFNPQQFTKDEGI